MGYKESLRQARELLLMEIGDLRTQLERKSTISEIESLLKESPRIVPAPPLSLSRS